MNIQAKLSKKPFKMTNQEKKTSFGCHGHENAKYYLTIVGGTDLSMLNSKINLFVTVL